MFVTSRLILWFETPKDLAMVSWNCCLSEVGVWSGALWGPRLVEQVQCLHRATDGDFPLEPSVSTVRPETWRPRRRAVCTTKISEGNGHVLAVSVCNVNVRIVDQIKERPSDSFNGFIAELDSSVVL